MRKTRDAGAASVPNFKPAPSWRAGKNKKRQDIAHAYPTDWRASRLRRARIDQAKSEDEETDIVESWT